MLEDYRRDREAILHKYSDLALQWLEDKGAINCGQCRQNRWDEAKVERVALIPFSSLPEDTAVGADLRKVAQGNTAFRAVCQHCGNILLIDERTLILNEEPRETPS